MEISGDLFDSRNSLAHCVSRDLEMGKGIAVAFKSRFGKVQELKKQCKDVGDVAYIQDNDRYIFYLITKEKYWQKPTYKSLTKCLEKLHELCIRFQIKELSIPRIGCGLDRLEWNKVTVILNDIFHDIKVTVFVKE